MASIDERVVAMSFENSKFESGVATTMRTLGKLDSSIQNVGKASGLDKLETQASRVTLNGPMAAVERLRGKLTTLQVAAGVVFGNIATMAVQKIGGMVKSLSLDPLLQGFSEYSTNLNSIQTILANTQDSGGNLQTVNAALQDLNRYSDKTIYNFGQMARNIGTFTAAGVRLKPATESIKGIANLAALSGSNAEQASTAMYQLSQAIAAGKVNLQDWNSVVNAGMGGAVFQKALLRTGQAMGTIAKGAVEIDKKTGHATINGETFRESLAVKPGEKSWLTSDVLVKTLGQFTGDLTNAQLKAQGFNDQQIAAIQKTAKTAKLAATEVKTLSGVFDVVKESIGSGWSNTFQIIFGNFEESKKTFTALSNYINGFVSRTFGAFDGILKQWKKLGGRTELIRGIKIAFDDILRVLRPLHRAFRQIFPPKTGKDLFDMTRGFVRLMNSLKPGHDTIVNLRRIFRGVFATFELGMGIIKGVIRLFRNLFDGVGKGSGGFLDFAANIGDILTRLDQFLIKGGRLNKYFDKLADILKQPLDILEQLTAAIASLLGIGGDTSGIDSFTDSVDGLNKKLDPFGRIVETAKKAWESFTKIIGKLKNAFGPMFNAIGKAVANFGDAVVDGIKTADYSKVFAAVNTVLLGGIFIALKKAIGGGVKVDLGGGLLKRIGQTFETLTGNLKAMQTQIQAKTILEIASALAILAVAVIVLSTIDPKKLANALSALAVGMGELVGAMALLNKTAGKGIARMPVIAAGLILLAGAMVIMAVAAKIFASMSWDEIARGLAGVAGMLAGIGAAVQLANPVKMLATGAAMIPIAVAITILAGAAKLFATMSWEDIAKGLAAVAGLMLGIGVAMNAFPPSAALMGPSLVLIAIAIGMLAGSVLAFGKMDQKTLAIGILAMAGALVAIGLAVNLFPPTLPLTAVGLLILAAAMEAISGVIATFGHMDIKTLARGILGMGGALLVLAVGLTAMEGTLPGSLALLGAAAAFAILAPALILMAQLSWSQLLHGLGAIAGIIAVLAIAGLVAGPALVALGIGLAAIGAGLILIGGAIYLAAKGLSLMSDVGIKAVAALLAAMALFIAAFPKMLIDFIKGIVSTLDEIVKLAPKIVGALIKILGMLLDAIIELAPRAAAALQVLITQLLKLLNENAQPMINAGFALLMNLLRGLGQNIGPITEQVGIIITNFLNALANQLPNIIAAGLRLLDNFLNGVVSGIPRIVGTVARIIVTFLNNIAAHIPEIVVAAVNLIVQFVNGLASQLPSVVSAGINLILGFISGIQQNIPLIIDKAVSLAKTFLTNLSTGLLRIVNIAADTLINFLHGLADAIREKEPLIMAAGYDVASAIGEGMLNGLKDIAPKLLRSVGDIAGDMIDKATSVFDIGSPSRVFDTMGKNIMLGLQNGINKNAANTNVAMANAAKGVVATGKKHLGKASKDMEINTKPVIKPVLDLSAVRKQAPELQKILSKSAVIHIAAASTKSAAAVATHQRKTSKNAGGIDTPAPATTVNFTQHNHSPEPLSNIEIYRQTNNQLSRIRNSIILKTPTTPLPTN